MNTKRTERGFTLFEILIALALLTGISLFLLNALTPWMSFKQKLDNDRKLMEMKTLFTTVYDRNAWTAETRSDNVFAFNGGTLTNSTLTATGTCQSQMPTLQALSEYFTDGLPQGELDGYANPFCILVSPQLARNTQGVTLYYHNIAIVSSGRDTRLESTMDATGALRLNGDDTGVLINGYNIHQQKYKETAARMARVASLYEAYFTTRFLSNPARDISVDYFATGNPSGAWDTGGSIGGTGENGFLSVRTQLQPLGVGPEEATTAYEMNNDITVGNYNGCRGGVCVRSSGGGQQAPFTAVLHGNLPGPAGNSIVRVVTGNY